MRALYEHEIAFFECNFITEFVVVEMLAAQKFVPVKLASIYMHEFRSYLICDAVAILIPMEYVLMPV